VPFLIKKDEDTSGLKKEYVLATYTCNATFVVTRNSWGFPEEMIGVCCWLGLNQHFGHAQIGLGIVNVLNMASQCIPASFTLLSPEVCKQV